MSGIGKTGFYMGNQVNLYELAQAFTPFTAPGEKLMAVRTGAYRAPKKGEWYISGAIPEAYRAPNDLATEFHIVRLVRVIPVTVYKIMDLDERQKKVLTNLGIEPER